MHRSCFVPNFMRKYRALKRCRANVETHTDTYTYASLTFMCLCFLLPPHKNTRLHIHIHTHLGWTERMGPVLKSYGSSILSTSLGSKALNTLGLDTGGTKIKDPVVGWDFIPPLGACRLDAPARCPSPQSQ